MNNENKKRKRRRRIIPGVLAAALLILVLCIVISVTVSTVFRGRDASTEPSPAPSLPLPTEQASSELATDHTECQTEPTVPTATEPAETEPTEPPTLPPEPDDDVFVRVSDYIPDIAADLRYATENNFTGQVIYEFTQPWLRYGTVKKLMQVQEELRQDGLYLKIWDGFRPVSAQFRLWEVCPDSRYVANPNNGYSSHSRGNTVDLTLVDADGNEVVMPTGFDDFSTLADRDYSDCDPEAAANAKYLEAVMVKYGFKPYSAEWWHYSDTQSYPVEEAFQPTDQ